LFARKNQNGIIVQEEEEEEEDPKDKRNK